MPFIHEFPKDLNLESKRNDDIYYYSEYYTKIDDDGIVEHYVYKNINYFIIMNKSYEDLFFRYYDDNYIIKQYSYNIFDVSQMKCIKTGICNDDTEEYDIISQVL